MAGQKNCAALVVALVAVFACVPAAAQVSQFSMIRECPQGCRDVDKATSCGSVDDTISCDMRVDGDVTISCKNGFQYHLGIFGCKTSTPNGTAPTPVFTDQWLVTRSATVARVVQGAYESQLYLCAALQAALALYCTLVGYRLRRITGVIFGALVGMFLGLGICVFAGDDGTSIVWAGVALGAVACGAICALGRAGLSGPLVGMANGGLVTCFTLVFEMHYSNSIMHIEAPLVFLGGILTGAIHGLRFPKPAVIFACIFTTFIGTMNAVAAFRDGVPVLRGTDTNPSKITIPIASGCAAATLCGIVQLFWRFRMRRAEMGRDYEALSLARDERRNWAKNATTGGYGAVDGGTGATPMARGDH